MDISNADTPPSLTEPMFLILVTLAGEDRHGYGIMQAVEEETGGAVRLGPGTLYRSIRRLLEESLIAESDRSPGPDEDERRRYYRITAAGRTAAKAEAERLDRVLGLARRRDLVPVAGAGGAS